MKSEINKNYKIFEASMEEINFEQNSIDTDYLNKLYEQEKIERLANNKLKCLEMAIKILSKFLESNDFIGYLTTMKNLHKKKDQSAFVIYGIIQSSAANFSSCMKSDRMTMQKYVECVKYMLENLKKINDKNNNFEEMKSKLFNYLVENKLEEFKDLIIKNNYDLDDLVTEKKQLKKISVGETTELNNSDSSTKIEKIEASYNKDYSSSSRNFNLISTNNKQIVSNTDTLGINQDIRNDNIRYSVVNTPKLPHLKIGVVITLSNSEIKRIFINQMQNNKAIVKGDENSDVIQANRKEFNLFRCCLECFHLTRANKNLNTIEFSINYSENLHERIIELRCLNGKRETCEALILSFISVLSKKMVKVRKIKSEAIQVDKILREQRDEEKRRLSNTRGFGSLKSYESLNEEENSIVDFSNKEATNFYELYRILSQENYELGKSVSDFIKNFKNENSVVSRSCNLIPKQMESILKFVDECVSAFFCYFNYGKSATEKMLPYVRPAVENIVFKKLSETLYDLYSERYLDENAKFKVNQMKIRKHLSNEEIMDYLEINKKFRVKEAENSENANGRLKGKIAFKGTIDYFNKIEFEPTPKDKFETLMRANLELRNEVLDITRGKYELNSMDDELPLFIYIVTQTNLKNVLVELNLIDNYLQFSPSLDKESKVLTNLRSSVYYIANVWKVEKTDNDKIA